MTEVFTMWRHTNMIVLTALCAAIYAAVLIPFQSIPIIPGHVSFRVAGVLPIALGLMFGPAGAWGAAIGNLIGDFFGTLSPGAVGGFFSNFFTGFVSYKLWSVLSPSKDLGVGLNSFQKLVRFEIIAVLKAFGTVVILTWWVCLLLRIAPAARLRHSRFDQQSRRAGHRWTLRPQNSRTAHSQMGPAVDGNHEA